MGEENDVIYKIALHRAKRLVLQYHSSQTDFKKYRCDEFLARLITDNKIKLDFYPFSTDKFCGLLTIDEDETTILINKKSPPYRRNFTIAHELGHYFLHKQLKTEFADRASDLLNSSNEKLEKQANSFASEIVLPFPVVHVMLRSRFSFKRIASSAQVSYETLRWRLVRHLIENNNYPYNKCIEIVNNFEESSFVGYKKSDLYDFL